MPYDSVYLEKRPPGALRTVWRKFYGDTTAMIGLYGCAALALLCVFGGWFAPYGIDQQFLGYQLLPPSWSRYGEVSFFLGTDDLGRDVLSRLLSGAAPTVGGAFVVTLGAALLGLVLGVIAGSTHGLRSAVMNHILDTLLSIPSLLLVPLSWSPSPGRTSATRCSPSGWRFCRGWCVRSTAWCMTNWKKSTLSPPALTGPRR